MRKDMKSTDVTDRVRFGFIDGELLDLTECVCGTQFDSWNFALGTSAESPVQCDHCGREFYFTNTIRVYEVKKGKK